MGSRHPLGQGSSGLTRALAVSALLLLTSCSFTQTPFVRQAQDAASSYAAAATTIEYLHTGKIDRRYASSSLVVYRDAVKGIQGTLPSQRGAPDAATLQPILSDIDAANGILGEPCLADGCDWQGQVDVLNRLRDELLEATQ